MNRSEILNRLEEVYSNYEESAHLIGLEYVNENELTIKRVKKGKGFAYKNVNEHFIKDKRILKRIAKLRIPPILHDVKFAPEPKYHLQAIGIDDAGRKQYFYSPKWNEFRQLLKYYRLLIVGRSLDKIRDQIDRKVNSAELDKDKVIATMVKILDESLIRIGSEQYAKDNDTYGLATMRKKHTSVKGDKTTFEFTGKSGVEQKIEVKDAKIAAIARKMLDMPGYELFKYKENGELKDVKSKDINDFLHQVTGKKISAKDFRTWGGTRICFKELSEYDHTIDKKEIKKLMKGIVDDVAGSLGNTNSVSKSHYIHPIVMSTFEEHSFNEIVKEIMKSKKQVERKNLKDEENLLMAFLERFLAGELEDILQMEVE